MGNLTYLLILLVMSLDLISGEHENEYGQYNLSPRSLHRSQFQQTSVLDVTKFGAVGDGKNDDSKAFETAWIEACSKDGPVVKLTVPSGKKFLLSPILFQGPCKGESIIFEILGSIIAQRKEAWETNKKARWLSFQSVTRLSVEGNGQGIIDGQGQSWWDNPKAVRPTAMYYSKCNNLRISGLKHVNSQMFHVSIYGCNNVNVSQLHITAPSESPNTDGIDVSHSQNIHIHNCFIGTGDDCIAIKGGTSNIEISQITCGPGHGISIGSLGENGEEDQVENIDIRNCTLKGTDNGIRIKTWEGGSGFARNINFTQIYFEAADNPVIIDQFYCPHNTCPKGKSGAVKISDVRYTQLHGTAVSKKATINLQCSKAVPCQRIKLENINITLVNNRENSAPGALCNNAYGSASSVSSPQISCLKPQPLVFDLED